MKKILLLAIALATPAVCAAEFSHRVVSTKELAESCKLMTDPEHKAFCVGYFSGTYETYLVTRHPEVSKPFICPKGQAPKRDELIAEFTQWSDSHAAYQNGPAADNVLRFLAGRYPCAKS